MNASPGPSGQINGESRRIDADLPLAIAGAERVRAFARLTALVMMVVCALLGGGEWKHWLVGALLGGLVVEINLTLLLRTLFKAADWRGRSLWPTLFRFYLAFGITIVACVLAVRNAWGHPLAFLLGLLSFFIGLSLGLLSLVIKAPAKATLPRRNSGDSPDASKAGGGRP